MTSVIITSLKIISSTSRATIGIISSDTSHICPGCGGSRDPTKARFEHRRLGLDEPLEPVLCKCVSPSKAFDTVSVSYTETMDQINIVGDTTMRSLPSPNPNMVIVETMSSVPTPETEIRLDPTMAKKLYERMENGLMPGTVSRNIREISCPWWCGPDMNVNARATKRSNGKSVIKITKLRYQILPGYTLAVSDE